MAGRGSVFVRLLSLGAVGVCTPLLLAQPPPPPAPGAGRVILVSLDGMGTRLFLDDPFQQVRSQAPVL